MPETATPLPPGDPLPEPRPSVLLVEDEPLIALMAMAALESARYPICGAAVTSREALRLAADRRPDLAIVDLQLANGRTGLALARELGQRFGTRCLLTTAWLAEDERVQVDARAVLCKPYSGADLLAAVAACLQPA